MSVCVSVCPSHSPSQSKSCTDFNFGMQVWPEHIKVKFKCQGHRSKLNVIGQGRGAKIDTVTECMIGGNRRSARYSPYTPYMNGRATTRGVVKAYVGFFFKYIHCDS